MFTPVDRTPPGNVRGLKRSVGYGLLEMAWGRPPDIDFDHVRVLLSTSPKKPARKVVYTGKARRYLNRSFKNGTYYRYSIVSYDHAGNASHGVTVVVAASALLRSPRDGSVVHSPPLFRWRAIKRASYYNVQLYYGARKVLSRWPRYGATAARSDLDLRAPKPPAEEGHVPLVCVAWIRSASQGSLRPVARREHVPRGLEAQAGQASTRRRP